MGEVVVHIYVGGKLLGPEWVGNNIKIIRDRLKTMQSTQKSHVDKCRRELEFETGDLVFLKLSLMKGVMCHLQYAEDSLIFCGEDEEQIRNVKSILLGFEVVSGLKVNFFKSELIGIRMEDSMLSKYAEILGCRVADLPASYLGLPLCVGSVIKLQWYLGVEKV